MKLPKTHIKKIESVKVVAKNQQIVKAEFIGREIEFSLYEAGVSYHNNRYTPTTVYLVSVDGINGSKFTGKRALENSKKYISEAVKLISE